MNIGKHISPLKKLVGSYDRKQQLALMSFCVIRANCSKKKNVVAYVPQKKRYPHKEMALSDN